MERFIGNVRREYLDHFLPLSEKHLALAVNPYVAYFNQDRPHLGIAQQIPNRPLPPLSDRNGKVIILPVLGCLHNRYDWAA